MTTDSRHAGPPLKLAFVLLTDLGMKDGVAPVNQFAGCWERQIGKWWIALNGHQDERKCSHGQSVPPFTCYVEFNGWPAGVIGPYGGVIAAGEGANEDAFIAAIEAEISYGQYSRDV